MSIYFSFRAKVSSTKSEIQINLFNSKIFKKRFGTKYIIICQYTYFSIRQSHHLWPVGCWQLDCWTCVIKVTMSRVSLRILILMGDFMPIIYINYNLYYYGGFRAPNCLMTFVTHDTRDLPPLKKNRKKVGDLFEDRNTNVVTLPSHLRCNGDCGLRLSEGQASLPPRSLT